MSGLKEQESFNGVRRGHVSDGLLLELINGSHIICFDERTIVAQWASQLGATIGNVVVARAICCRRKLLEELQICKCSGINCFVVALAQIGPRGCISQNSHLDWMGLARVEERKRLIAAAILNISVEAISVKSVECTTSRLQSKQET